MKKNAGYSMIELLLTVVFVMLGTQMIQGGLLGASAMFGRYSNTLQVMVWAGERMAVSREALLRGEWSASESGVLHTPHKDIDWHEETRLLDGPDLYSILLSASWAEGGRPQSFQKEMYVYQKKNLSQAA